MIPYEVVVHVPPPAGTAESRADEGLRTLLDRLRAAGRGRDDVLSLTLFVDAPDAAALDRVQGPLIGIVHDLFDGTPPATSVVAQAPEAGCHVAIEASVLSPAANDARVVRASCAGIPYSRIEGRGTCQVHAGGLASTSNGDGADTPAKEAFARMESVLRREAMTFGHVVRQWGYIEGMLDVSRDGTGDHQGYQAFNDVRTLEYARSRFPSGYPAATGIGQAAGGVVLEFVALDAPADVRVEPVSNPRQVDAHRYSDGVLVGEAITDVPGKTSPKFERAKRVAGPVDEVVFVSGTAAILGERSVAPGDVAAQTRTTLDNIASLVGGRPLTSLRAYVKRLADIPVVREVCEAEHGSIPALYVQADVCRDELLVEIEGVLVAGAAGHGRPRANGSPGIDRTEASP